MEKETHNKKTIRITLYNKYDLQSLQIYLSDMAKKGLFLKHLGIISIFEKGEPQEVEYRFDPMTAEYTTFSEEKKEATCTAYEKQGWTFVNTYLRLFMIYSQNQTESCNQEDSNGSKTEQESKDVILTDTYTYKKLRKSTLCASLSIILCSLFISILCTKRLFIFDLTTYSIIKTDDFFILLFFLIGFVYILFDEIREERYRNRICFSYEIGCEIPKTKKKRDVLSSIAYIIYVLLIIIGCYVLIFDGKHTSKQHNLSEYSGELPYISLLQMEQATLNTDADIESAKMNYPDSNSYYISESSFLVPIQLIINEGVDDYLSVYDYLNVYDYSSVNDNFSINDYFNADDAEKKGNRSRIYTRYYELRFEYLTDIFFRQMLNELIDYKRNENITIKNLQEETGLRCYYIKTNTYQYIMGHYGKKVILVGYYGEKELEQRLDDVVKILK